MSFLKNIFSKKVTLPPADLSVLRADMHSHLIPGIDDGSDSMEESIDMIRQLSALGLKKLITTPHIMSDYYRNTPEIIREGLSELQKSVKEAGIEIELDAAAEYYLDENLEEKITNKNILTFGDNYLLFELPFISEPPMTDELMFKMQTGGYKPVLAHVERYPFWYEKPEKYQQLREKGILLQVNINSLTGYYSPQAKKIAESLIDQDLISFLGTDCHNQRHLNVLMEALRTPALHKALDSGSLLNSEL